MRLPNHAAKAFAVVVLAVLYVAARPLPADEAERRALAARFAFSRLPLAELADLPTAHVRQVHPSLERISAWISSVGASVALADLDGDGLHAEVCHVDPRVDRVIVSPAPGTPQRFAPFALGEASPPGIAPMGCLPGDLDEDGREDLLVYFWGRPPVAFLRTGDGPLAAAAFQAVDVAAAGERWFTNAATRADVDGDGRVDLVIGNYFPDGANILGGPDGRRESMQTSMSRAYNGGRNRVLLARPPAPGERLRYVEAETGLDDDSLHGWALAVGAADLDGDLLPEIYFGHDFGPDRLLHNRSRPGSVRLAVAEGRRGIAVPASKVLGHDSFKGMGVDFADLNGDGILDIYVSNIAQEWALEESHFVFVSDGRRGGLARGRADWTDRSEELGLARSGWGWESRFADLDNDGVFEAMQATGFVLGDVDRWPELHEIAMGNDLLLSNPRHWPRLQPGDDLSGRQPNAFFVRTASGRYVDLAADVGLGQVQVSRGIAVADVDGDGNLDFAVANQWEPSYFHRNEAPNPGRFLGLQLLLPLAPTPFRAEAGLRGWADTPVPARAAIGASATVILPDGRRLVAQVDGGNGHSGTRSPQLHFGLGKLAEDAELVVELAWRDRRGRVETRTVTLAPGWHTVILGAAGSVAGTAVPGTAVPSTAAAGTAAADTAAATITGPGGAGR